MLSVKVSADLIGFLSHRRYSFKLDSAVFSNQKRYKQREYATSLQLTIIINIGFMFQLQAGHYDAAIHTYLAQTPEIGQGLGRFLSCGARKQEQT